MSDAPLSVERSDDGSGVAVLTFHHGPLNLFDQSMFDALIAHVAELAADPLTPGAIREILAEAKLKASTAASIMPGRMAA